MELGTELINLSIYCFHLFYNINKRLKFAGTDESLIMKMLTFQNNTIILQIKENGDITTEQHKT